MNPRLPTENFSITVEPKHILKGRPISAEHCALSLSANEYLHQSVHQELKTSVSPKTIIIIVTDGFSDKNDVGENDYLKIETQPDLQNWIRDFDKLSGGYKIQVEFDLKEMTAKSTRIEESCWYNTK